MGGAQHLVVSLVGPLDIANFHYLKKFVEFEFTPGEAPPRENRAAATLRTLEQRAQQGSAPDAEQSARPEQGDMVEVVVPILDRGLEHRPQLGVLAGPSIEPADQLTDRGGGDGGGLGQPACVDSPPK